MSAEIWVAIITSLCTLLGVVITVRNGNSKTLYRIEQLEQKVNKHNSLIDRMYKVEDRLNVDEEKIKVANNRLKNIEDELK